MVNTLEDKLDAEVTAHGRTKEEYEKLQEEANKKEVVIKGLRELADKKKCGMKSSSHMSVSSRTKLKYA